MNGNFQEADLLQKYRQSISKRYKGYNRVIQLNLNKPSTNSIQVKKQNQQQKVSSSSKIQFTKNTFSQTNTQNTKTNHCLVIRTTNPQINLQQINTQTELNKKKFIKTKFLKHSNPHSLNQKEKQPTKQQNTQRLIKNTVEQFLDNKFKFKKRFMKNSVRLGLPQDSQFLLRNQLIMRLEPFSPIIRGEKKNTHAPESKNKKSKTQYQAAISNDETKRDKRNITETKNSKINELQNFKRTNSFMARKSGTKTVIQSFSTSIQAPKLLKKLSSNFQSKNYFESNGNQKLSFPKINCANKQSSKSTENQFEPKLQLQRNKQKFKKTPLLLRYQFDVKDVDSQSFIVVESESQSILYGHRFNSGYQIASLTKIMTFYVVLRLIEQFNIDIKEEKVEIQYQCTNIGGTSADLYPGQIYSLESLLYGLMLPSGNDAALSLAVWGGKFNLVNPQDSQACISHFVALMNKEAKSLNLIETRFGNPHGLPHKYARSTAFDIAKLCMYCMKDQLFKKVVETKTYKCVVSTKKGRKRFNVWENTNKLLRRQGFIGIKTGITITAGPCLASAYKFQQKTYICVILRAKKISRRFKQTRKILHWCLQKLYKDNLSNESILRLKNLKKNNAQLDSDYSEDENIFRYDVNNSKQFRKRCDIISQM